MVLVLLSAVGVAGATVVSSFAFSSVQGERGANVDIADDDSALVGIELSDGIVIGDDGELPDCSVTNDTVVVTGQVSDDIETEHGVVIESGARVDADIEAGGCVDVESSGRIDGDVTAGGDVTVRSGARIDGSVETDGSVSLASGSRVSDDVVAGGDVTLASSSRIRGDVESGGEVSLDSGARIDGDVEVTAEDKVSLAGGARIDGDIEVNPGAGGGDGDGGPVFLVAVTNNFGQSATITVSLSDASDGTLLGGSQSGSSVAFELDPGEQASVNIDPSSSADGQIEIQIEAETENSGARVTLTRSVPTSQA